MTSQTITIEVPIRWRAKFVVLKRWGFFWLQMGYFHQVYVCLPFVGVYAGLWGRDYPFRKYYRYKLTLGIHKGGLVIDPPPTADLS